MAKSKPVRLLLTITADKMPEWHACLQSIDSGYVRAEIVRKGLKRIKPNQIQLMNEVLISDAFSPTTTKETAGVAPAAESQGGMAARMIQSGLGGNWGPG